MSNLLVGLAAATLKSTLVLVLAWALNQLLRTSHPSLRHTIWTAALILSLAMPALQTGLPKMAVLPSARAITDRTSHPSLLLRRGAGSKDLAAYTMEQARDTSRADVVSHPGSPRQTLVLDMRVKAANEPALATPGAGKIEPHARTTFTTNRHLPQLATLLASRLPKTRSVALSAIWIWASGFAACLVGILLAHASAAHLRWRAKPLVLPFSSRSMALQAGLRKKVAVLVNDRENPSSAMTTGILFPAIIFPTSIKEWPIKRVAAVMIHELAHIRRGDVATQLVGRFACAMYWFNPVVWLCAKAARKEAELAADAFVLTQGWSPSSYAEDLMAVAASVSGKKSMLHASGVPMAKNSNLETRIRAILNRSHVQTNQPIWKSLLAGGFVAAMSLPVAALAFQDPAVSATSASKSATAASPSVQVDPAAHAQQISVALLNQTASLDRIKAHKRLHRLTARQKREFARRERLAMRSYKLAEQALLHAQHMVDQQLTRQRALEDGLRWKPKAEESLRLMREQLETQRSAEDALLKAQRNQAEAARSINLADPAARVQLLTIQSQKDQARSVIELSRAAEATLNAQTSVAKAMQDPTVAKDLFSKSNQDARDQTLNRALTEEVSRANSDTVKLQQDRAITLTQEISSLDSQSKLLTKTLPAAKMDALAKLQQEKAQTVFGITRNGQKLYWNSDHGRLSLSEPDQQKWEDVQGLTRSLDNLFHPGPPATEAEARKRVAQAEKDLALAHEQLKKI